MTSETPHKDSARSSQLAKWAPLIAILASLVALLAHGLSLFGQMSDKESAVDSVQPPIHCRIQVHSLIVEDTKETGKPWDMWPAGGPDLKVSIKVGSRRLLETEKQDNSTEALYDTVETQAITDAFEWSAEHSVRLLIIDEDVKDDDRVATIILPEAVRRGGFGKVHTLSGDMAREVRVSLLRPEE